MQKEADYCYRMAAALGYIREVLNVWVETGNAKRAIEEVAYAINALDLKYHEQHE